MSSTPLLLALIGHLVGDYLLQNDWMAQNKKLPGLLGFWACVIHCVIWTICVCLFAGWPLQHAPIAPILFALHFSQDRTHFIRWWMWTMRQRQFMEFDRIDLMDMRIIPGAAPWSLIVVDNVWHVVQIWAVWRFLA